MLEPRRVATRAAAWRLADLRGEEVGQTVGYRMRGERRVGRATRVEVVTEGVLTRRLQRDPTLDGVGILVFDEFHERSLDADLGLALALRTRALLRDDLRIVVMSATLDGESVARLLGDAPIVTSHGRSFPIETRYVEPRRELRIEGAVANAIVEALRGDEGDVLAFLPGAGEIRRVEASARRASRPERRRHAALRDARTRRAGSRALPGSRRAPQGRAVHVDRRNEPHHRGNSRRRGQRALARAALLASHGDDAPRDGARLEILGRSASRARRPNGAGDLLPSLGGARDHAPARAVSARDPARRPGPARARPRGGRRHRVLGARLARHAARGGVRPGARAVGRVGRRRHLRHRDGARAGDGRAGGPSATRAHARPREGARRRANGVRPRRAALGARRAPIAATGGASSIRTSRTGST